MLTGAPVCAMYRAYRQETNGMETTVTSDYSRVGKLCCLQRQLFYNAANVWNVTIGSVCSHTYLSARFTYSLCGELCKEHQRTVLRVDYSRRRRAEVQAWSHEM